MVEFTKQTQYLNPYLRFVNSSGRLTGQGYRYINAIAEILDTISIEDGEVTAAKIAANTITADEISVKSLDADEILVDGTIITDLIGNNQLSVAGQAYTEAEINGTSLGSDPEMQAVTISGAGDRVLILFSVNYGSTDPKEFSITLKRDTTTIASTSVGSITNTSGSDRKLQSTLLFIDSSPGDDYTVEGVGEDDDVAVSHRRLIILNLLR